ncbi:MAG: S1 RNA-binding domain-containing protein [Anaerolineales bacterium]|nr:S1 RNA-binding domain-containing protein [Anaerolineales bacterium]
MTENPGMGGKILLADLKPKTELKGKVKRIELSGAVVDVGAERDGLLHISALGREKVSRVQDVLQPDQEISVWVKKVDPAKGELQLTMTAPLAHDWGDMRTGTVVRGKVTRIEKFGVFLDFGAERPGLIHISELSNEYVKDIASVTKVGDEIEATILEVDRKKKQVHLSRKALEAKPQPQAKAKEEAEEPEEPELKTITAMEAAFLKAQGGNPGETSAGTRMRELSEKKRRQQEDILNRTLQTAPRK